MPLMWQEKTDEGHKGAYTIGSIDSIQILDDMVTASGTLLDLFPDKQRVIEMIEAGVIGPSVDLDDFSYVMTGEDSILVTQARVSGATLVPIEAFAEVSIHMGASTAQPSEVMVASAAAQVLPSIDDFKNPGLDGPMAITITDEGRVFGHIAVWGTCHVGLPGCVTAPSSQTEYAYFMTGGEKTAEGVTVPVGKLTVGGGHAEPNAGFVAAAEHYDNVGTAVASVFAGEDEHGIWVAGRILPGVSHEAVSALQRSPISGDWRRIGGNLELVAAHAVNVPGFPVPRAKVRFSAGDQLSLVAALVMPEKEPEPEVVEKEDTTIAQLAAKAQWAWKQKGR
jgi:hypothetical protein